MINSLSLHHCCRPKAPLFPTGHRAGRPSQGSATERGTGECRRDHAYSELGPDDRVSGGSTEKDGRAEVSPDSDRQVEGNELWASERHPQSTRSTAHGETGTGAHSMLRGKQCQMGFYVWLSTHTRLQCSLACSLLLRVTALESSVGKQSQHYRPKFSIVIVCLVKRLLDAERMQDAAWDFRLLKASMEAEDVERKTEDEKKAQRIQTDQYNKQLALEQQAQWALTHKHRSIRNKHCCRVPLHVGLFRFVLFVSQSTVPEQEAVHQQSHQGLLPSVRHQLPLITSHTLCWLFALKLNVTWIPAHR